MTSPRKQDVSREVDPEFVFPVHFGQSPDAQAFHRFAAFRGMDNDKSAQIMADGIRINCDFVRPHMGLDEKTPAQVAGLDLPLQGIRWKELIEQATRRKVNKGCPEAQC